MMKARSSGILLPVFSLPGDYGIGTLGREARSFLDFLAQGGQHTWQILPLVPPGSGDSPYMSPSAFAGNPWFLDLEELADRELLTREELESARSDDLDHIDYDRLRATRLPLLRKAWERGRGQDKARRAAFEAAHAHWLPDYALFMALKDHFGGVELAKWPDKAVRLREPEALAKYRALLADEIDFQCFLQYHFFRQWTDLRAYAKARDIAIMGDAPIYVSPDSAEVWARPELFQLGKDFVPKAVAGVPPDAFSTTGQLWGNPLYDWKGHKDALFQWWGQRMTHAALLYDQVRIDHFRGIHTYWAVPAKAETALAGKWQNGPGQPLLDYLARTVPQLSLVAEDLGDLDAKALAFIANSGLPGMKILVYAFDPVGESAYLPHNCPRQAVIYTGTHDTPTFVQWLFEQAAPAEREYAFDYLRLNEAEGFGWGAVRGAWASPCALAIAPLQDILGLGADARINTPGTTGTHNWSWRVRREAFNPDVSGKLAKLTRIYRR